MLYGKKKEVFLKPGEKCPIPMEVGVKYYAATPLRESKWRAVSACCKVRIERDAIIQAAIEARIGDDPTPGSDAITGDICTQCKKPCDKQWITISKLIPSLARTDDQKWHLMDQF